MHQQLQQLIQTGGVGASQSQLKLLLGGSPKQEFSQLVAGHLALRDRHC
jgi:hypothetical protein